MIHTDYMQTKSYAYRSHTSHIQIAYNLHTIYMRFIPSSVLDSVSKRSRILQYHTLSILSSNASCAMPGGRMKIKS